jgi:predicted lipoprotein with Yx(FWY)xxD motif
MSRLPLVALVTAVVVSALVVSTTASGGRVRTDARAVVKTAFNKKLKKSIVTDGSVRTLYMFVEDVNGVATNCTPSGPWGTECPALWPPLTSQGAPLAGTGINAALLTVKKRSDGKRQVSYNHHPLYYWHGGAGHAGDKKPGDVNGEEFVGEWYVLTPKGTPIK